MALINLHAVLPGDLVVRKKATGTGLHYGTGVRGGSVKDTMPETGQRVVTLEKFGEGLPVYIYRYNRTPFENAIVEQRALANLNGPYLARTANCEHDAWFNQTGVAFSPTVDGIQKLLGISVGAYLLYRYLSDN